MSLFSNKFLCVAEIEQVVAALLAEVISTTNYSIDEHIVYTNSDGESPYESKV